ncbi:MAG TPA: hypothetical protein VE817_04370 [Candidatus Acidoferrum sp.]|nr:hypothetical protein [Candidatus Acidoferrum sp.]
MAIELHRPTDIRIGSARLPGRPPGRHGVTPRALDIAIRGLLAGTGIGILLVAHAGFASIPVLGVLALGAALLSWDP